MNPIILNRNHILTNFIVQDCHLRIKHNGERHRPLFFNWDSLHARLNNHYEAGVTKKHRAKK